MRALALLFLLPAVGCAPATPPEPAVGKGLTPTRHKAKSANRETAVFGGGCFWGLEYRFREVKGVTGTAVGYSGGTTKQPTYEQVCAKGTGHAEVVLVEFDPALVSFRSLATLFFSEFHNPTQMNRQGPDVGTNYRSALYFSGESQRKVALEVRDQVQAGLKEKVVTEISPASTFWPAEAYHQNYIERTGHYLCPIEPPSKKG